VQFWFQVLIFGHKQGAAQNRQTTRKGKQAKTHTRIRKLTRKNTTERHKWKCAKYNHVQEKATKTVKQIPSGI
jgi:hypothetical protein